ncbi:MAG: sensor histidine kinase [Gracilimonas sp.]
MVRFWKFYKFKVHKNCIGGLSFTDGLDFWRNKLFFTIVLYLLPLALILLIPSIIMTYFMELAGLAVAYVIFAVTITFIALYSGLNITLRKYCFLGLLYIVANSLIFFMGQHGAGITYLFGVTVFALLILPPKAGKITVFINVAICILHGYFISQNLVDYPLRDSFQVISWFLISGNSILLSIMAVIFMPMLFTGLQNTIVEQYHLENKLLVHQEELEGSLKEKETLLAEIHHRVKNNLAVVSGMLQLQAFKEMDEQMKKKLLDSTLRIKSMANIHEQLYRSHSFSNMEFDIGLENLAQTIFQTLDNSTEINAKYDLEAIQLNINQAVPCSLIVNEVLTNSIKHAFDQREEGLITIHLSKDRGRLHLKITDNGDGFPEKLNRTENDSLGMELIDTLSVQLEAEYDYRNREEAKGTLFELKFKISDSSGSSAT